jgi:ABC-type Fe3+-siderophore transport system permease subunit
MPILIGSDEAGSVGASVAGASVAASVAGAAVGSASVAPVSGIASVAVAGAPHAARSRINDRRIGVIFTANLRGDFLLFIFILPPNIYKVSFTEYS